MSDDVEDQITKDCKLVRGKDMEAVDSSFKKFSLERKE